MLSVIGVDLSHRWQAAEYLADERATLQHEARGRVVLMVRRHADDPPREAMCGHYR
jgi:hypothetical protein